MLPCQLLFHDQRVHDREDPGLLVIGELHATKVLEQPCHARPECRRAPGTHVGVELARRHHVAEIPAGRDGLPPDVGRKRHVHLLHLRSLAPFEPEKIFRRDTVLLFEHPADPHCGGHVVLRHAHTLADQIARLLDAGVSPNEDRRVAEAERRKDRNGDEGLAAASQHGVGGERELRDVELAEPGHAIEHLLRGERHDVELDAVGLDLARPDRAGPVVVAARQREVESRHARYREAAGTASTTADFLPL